MTDIFNMKDEMNRLFDGLFRGVSSEPGRFGAYVPEVDISETDDNIMVSVDIPGMDEKDLSVSIRENVLTLKGEKKREVQKENTVCLISERNYGSFERSLTLPTNIQPDKVAAKYANGVLTVTLPKAEEVKPKEIAVKVA